MINFYELIEALWLLFFIIVAVVLYSKLTGWKKQYGQLEQAFNNAVREKSSFELSENENKIWEKVYDEGFNAFKTEMENLIHSEIHKKRQGLTQESTQEQLTIASYDIDRLFHILGKIKDLKPGEYIDTIMDTEVPAPPNITI